MKIESYPTSCFTSAARSAFGGVLAFYIGLVWATVIVFCQGLTSGALWTWFAIGWLILIPYTIAKVWGILTTCILAILFVGMVWGEWNRAIGASATAILLSVTSIRCYGHNPFNAHDSGVSFLVTLGIAAIVFALGVVWEVRIKRASNSGPVRTGAPRTARPPE